MRAYDLDSGIEIWKTQDKGAIAAQASYALEKVFYGTVQGRLYARHYLTGELQYAIDLGMAIESAPVILHGRLYVPPKKS